MKLYEKIAVYRKKCGLSQETLAEKIGVSRQAVSKWETGDALPEITKLKSLAECFGVTVDFLLDENTDEYQPEKNEKSTGFDRLIEKLEKLVPVFGRYGWIVGSIFVLLGVYMIARGAIVAITVLPFADRGAIPIIFLMLLLPITIIALGVLMMIGGIIIIKKSKKNNS